MKNNNYNLKPLPLYKQKELLLQLLSDIHDFCEKHDITYFLAYGTLLGAIRHKGFIPWDDDIDILMPRNDYMRFLQIFNKQNTVKNIKLFSPYCSKSRHAYIKVCNTDTVKIEKSYQYQTPLGLDIDIFPLDGEPADYKTYKKMYRKKQPFFKLFDLCITDGKNMSLKLKPLFYFLYPFRNFVKKLCILIPEHINKPYTYENSDYIGCTCSLYNSIKNRYNKEWFEKRILVSFENKEFYAPADYDKILTQLYGDYMTLPPKEQQKTHHINNVYTIER